MNPTTREDKMLYALWAAAGMGSSYAADVLREHYQREDRIRRIAEEMGREPAQIPSPSVVSGRSND